MKRLYITLIFLLSFFFSFGQTIKKIDLKDVKKSEGVISVVTYNDIPGRNDVGPVFDGDPIFPKTKV